MSDGTRRVAGLHAVTAALDHNPTSIVSAWFEGGRRETKFSKIIDALTDLGASVRFVSRDKLDALAEGRQHQGVVIELRMPREKNEDDLRAALENPQGVPLFLFLDHVQDPHNFGACLRTADAAGVHGVVVTKDQAAGLTPTVAKLACGAAETMPIYRVTNLVRALGVCKSAGLWVAGADGQARKNHFEADFSVPLVVVLGAEGKGLRRLTRDHCDFLVRIPMSGKVESLNVSVAAGVLLFEVLRQRHSR